MSGTPIGAAGNIERADSVREIVGANESSASLVRRDSSSREIVAEPKISEPKNPKQMSREELIKDLKIINGLELPEEAGLGKKISHWFQMTFNKNMRTAAASIADLENEIKIGDKIENRLSQSKNKEGKNQIKELLDKNGPLGKAIKNILEEGGEDGKRIRRMVEEHGRMGEICQKPKSISLELTAIPEMVSPEEVENPNHKEILKFFEPIDEIKEMKDLLKILLSKPEKTFELLKFSRNEFGSENVGFLLETRKVFAKKDPDHEEIKNIFKTYLNEDSPQTVNLAYDFYKKNKEALNSGDIEKMKEAIKDSLDSNVNNTLSDCVNRIINKKPEIYGMTGEEMRNLVFNFQYKK